MVVGKTLAFAASSTKLPGSTRIGRLRKGSRGLAWREVVAAEGQATYGINRRRKNRWGSCEPRMTRG